MQVLDRQPNIRGPWWQKVRAISASEDSADAVCRIPSPSVFPGAGCSVRQAIDSPDGVWRICSGASIPDRSDLSTPSQAFRSGINIAEIWDGYWNWSVWSPNSLACSPDPPQPSTVGETPLGASTKHRSIPSPQLIQGEITCKSRSSSTTAAPSPLPTRLAKRTSEIDTR